MLITSILTLLGIGLILALMLVAASHIFQMDEDPRIEELVDALPGANCGGCGYAGCEAYAQAVLLSPDVPSNLCTVGGAAVAAAISLITGKAAAASEPMQAFRRCERVEGQVAPRYDYIGPQNCASAATLENGPYMCPWACLGFGDCTEACAFNALQIIDGLPEVLSAQCVACGACVKACPHSVLQLMPKRARVNVHCTTTEKLKQVSDVCRAGCFNCLKCLKACPAKAISHKNGRIEIDQAACLAFGESCQQACVSACPRGILRSFCQEVAAAPQNRAEQKTCACAAS